jgi:uncharacterized membrane protein (UPF0127 family)
MRERAAFLIVLLLLGCAQPMGAAPEVIPLTLPSGKLMQTEVMVSDEDRAMGLMFRDTLPQDHALLFIFENLDFHAIWMKNCKFPIDIVWLDENREVVHVASGVPPCKKDPCPTYQPLRRAAYVIEMNSGAARKNQMKTGATVSFNLPR